jgi:hypothetical protein
MTEHATYDALTPQLFAGHLLNESVEIQTREIRADARQAACQVIAQTTLSAAGLGYGPGHDVLPTSGNKLLCD